MLAACHGPIEEQARLSIHPHILLFFVHTQSEHWLRSILRKETEEARTLLRSWQEKVLVAVQSMQLDSAAVLPLLLVEDPATVEAPANTPFSEQHQEECRFDGALEGDVYDPQKRRPLLATAPLFEDHHVSRAKAASPELVEPPKEYLLPQTGAQLAKLPHYRLFLPTCIADLDTEEGRRNEADNWRRLYSEDYRQNIAVGQMHMHKDTCFKYVMDKSIRVAKHCRFHFCHFVRLFLRGKGEENTTKHVREVVLARTGKDRVLPRKPADEQEPIMFPLDTCGSPLPLSPTSALGPTVNTDWEHGKAGLVMPIRWNPMEGSSNGPAQVSIRGNTDYQSMMRTFLQGFTRSLPDWLRQPPRTEKQVAADEALEDEQFEAELPKKIKTHTETASPQGAR